MLNNTIILKVKQRLNKLDSQDYDNLEKWQIIEAFNKGMVDWCRRNLHGLNIVKEGDEQSTRRIDDLQVLLTTTTPLLTKRGNYYETDLLPEDYLQWKRLSVSAKNDCCIDPRPMKVYMTEQGNLDIVLSDKNKQPNFEWAETCATLGGNKVQIYTDGTFEIVNPILTYYRQPRRIAIANEQDPYTFQISQVDVESEFKDDLNELFIMEAEKIISGDLESANQTQISTQSVENDN